MPIRLEVTNNSLNLFGKPLIKPDNMTEIQFRIFVAKVKSYIDDKVSKGLIKKKRDLVAHKRELMSLLVPKPKKGRK